MTDCDRTSGGVEGTWNETEDGNVGSLSTLHGDHFYLYITSSGGNKVYWVSNATNLGINTNVYPLFLYRYKTMDSIIKAKIVAEFSDASTQTILAETSNTMFQTGSITLTAGKTLDHILLYANQATGWVLYDYTLVCKGAFTFPNCARIRFNPPPRYALLEPPHRMGDITQNMGSESASVEIGCDLTVGDWTGGGIWDKPAGIIEDIVAACDEEPWQWLTTPRWNFKATLENPTIDYEDKLRIANLLFREFRLSNATNETYIERFGMNL